MSSPDDDEPDACTICGGKPHWMAWSAPATSIRIGLLCRPCAETDAAARHFGGEITLELLPRD